MNFAFFKSYKKTYTYLMVISIAVVAIVSLLLLVISNGFFTSHSDDFLQYFAISENFVIKLKSGNLSLYSYDTYFGSSFFSDLYYVPFDIFTFITCFLSFFMRFEIAFGLTELLKLFAGTMLLAHYLKMRGVKNKSLFFVSLIYLFCGYNTIMMAFPVYFSLVFYFPLMAICLEYFMNHNKKWILLFATAGLLYFNFYAAYTVIMFMALLFIVNYLIDNKFMVHKKEIVTVYKLDIIENNMVAFLKYGIQMAKKSLQCCGLMLLGVLMGVVILYPSALYILNDTYRVASTQGGVVDKWAFNLNHYFRILVEIFTPNTSTGFYGFNQSYLLDHVSLYITVTGFIILAGVFTKWDRKSNIYKLLLIIESISLLYPIIYMVMSGNTAAYVRWFGIINFFNMIIIAHVLDGEYGFTGDVIKSNELYNLFNPITNKINESFSNGEKGKIKVFIINMKNRLFNFFNKAPDIFKKLLYRMPTFIRNGAIIYLIFFGANFYTKTLYNISAKKYFFHYLKLDRINAFTKIIGNLSKAPYQFNELIVGGNLTVSWKAASLPSLTDGIVLSSIIDIWLLGFAVAIVLIITLVGIQKKFNILPYVLMFELCLAAGFMFAPKFHVNDKLLFIENRDSVNEYMDKYIPYSNTLERVYVDSNVDIGTDINFTKTNLELSGLRMFHSFMDEHITTDEPGVIDFIDLLYSVNEGQAGRKRANKSSLFLNQIIGNKYIVTTGNDKINTSRYYKRLNEFDSNDYSIYELETYTPFMIYNKSFSSMPYIDVINREEALLNYVYYKEELDITEFTRNEVEDSLTDLSYVGSTDDWVYRNDDFTNNQPYIYYDLSSIDIPTEGIIKFSMTNVSDLEKVFLVDYDGDIVDATDECIYMDSPIKEVYVLNSNSVIKSNKRITFKHMGYDGFEEFTNRMSQFHNQELKINKNNITGSYTRNDLERTDILAIPICYNESWSVVNDSYELISVNGGFIGLVIPPGEQDISFSLHFEPDGYNIGAMISGLTFLCAGAFILVYFIIKDKNKDVEL